MGIDLKDHRITYSDRHLVFHRVHLNKIASPENLTRIFNHGFTTRAEGIGFGLNSGALADRELGGSLSVRGDGLGQGATFSVELPLQFDALSTDHAVEAVANAE
jgi:sensor histidine kinase regulating citrate/malate metabolism